jgi:hypothetical protein
MFSSLLPAECLASLSSQNDTSFANSCSSLKHFDCLPIAIYIYIYTYIHTYIVNQHFSLCFEWTRNYWARVQLVENGDALELVAVRCAADAADAATTKASRRARLQTIWFRSKAQGFDVRWRRIAHRNFLYGWPESSSCICCSHTKRNT